MHETDQDANGGLWVFSLAAGQFRLGAVPDDYSGAIPASSLLLSATRSGAQITSATIRGGAEIELNADLLDFNGDADISGSLTVGGTISGNGSGLTNLNASNLSSGTVPDARLPANIPRLNASALVTGAWTFDSADNSTPLAVRRSPSNASQYTGVFGTSAGNFVTSYSSTTDTKDLYLRATTNEAGAAGTQEPAVIVRGRANTDIARFSDAGIALNGTTVTVNGVNVRDAAILSSGSLDPARVPQSAVTQHQSALSISASQITSGSLDPARVPQSAVTQHQAALSIAFEQLGGVPQIPGGLPEYVDDAAAAAGGVPVNGLYRTGSVVKIRVT